MASNPVVIRAATEDDAWIIAEFNTHLAMETEGKSLSLDSTLLAAESVIEDDNKGFYLLLEQDKAVVGQLLITYEWSDWRCGVFWWIQSAYVIPNARGRGGFKSMYEYVVEKAKREPSVCWIRLYVENENTKAQEVYTKLGMDRTNYTIFEHDLEM